MKRFIVNALFLSIFLFLSASGLWGENIIDDGRPFLYPVNVTTKDGQDVYSFSWDYSGPSSVNDDSWFKSSFSFGYNITYPSGQALFAGQLLSGAWGGYQIWTNFFHSDPFSVPSWDGIVGYSDENGNLSLPVPEWVEGVGGYGITAFGSGTEPLSFSIVATFTGPTQGPEISYLSVPGFVRYGQNDIGFAAVLNRYVLGDVLVNFEIANSNGVKENIGSVYTNPYPPRPGPLYNDWAYISWDGSFNGEPAPLGTYYLTAKVSSWGDHSMTSVFRIVDKPIIETIEVTPEIWAPSSGTLMISATSDQPTKIELSVTPPDSDDSIILVTDLQTDDSWGLGSNGTENSVKDYSSPSRSLNGRSSPRFIASGTAKE